MGPRNQPAATAARNVTTKDRSGMIITTPVTMRQSQRPKGSCPLARGLHQLPEGHHLLPALPPAKVNPGYCPPDHGGKPASRGRGTEGPPGHRVPYTVRPVSLIELQGAENMSNPGPRLPEGYAACHPRPA